MRTIVILILLIILTACDPIYPFCDKEFKEGIILGHRYTPSYVSMEKTSEVCTTISEITTCTPIYSAVTHSETFQLVVMVNDKTVTRSVSSNEYRTKDGEKFTVEVCRQ